MSENGDNGPGPNVDGDQGGNQNQDDNTKNANKDDLGESQNNKKKGQDIDDGEDDTDKNYQELVKERQNELRQFKGDNAELRKKQKQLSDDLTKTLDKLRVRTTKKPMQPKNREDTLCMEIKNADKKIESYEKEITRLEEKIKVGSEIAKIQNLEDDLFNKTKELEDLRNAQRDSNKDARKQERKMMKDLNEKEQHVKLHTKIEEEKFLKKKQRDLEIQELNRTQNLGVQADFIDKIFAKYTEICAATGEEKFLELKEEEGVKNVIDHAPKPSKEHKFKYDQKKVKEWKELADPDAYVPQNSEHEFEWFKDKVISLRKNFLIQESTNKWDTNKGTTAKTTTTNQLGLQEKQIVDKDKELEMLIKQCNEVRKGIRHNVLLPMDLIKEEHETKTICLGNCNADDSEVTKISEPEGQNENLKGIRAYGITFWMSESGEVVGLVPLYSYGPGKPIGNTNTDNALEFVLDSGDHIKKISAFVHNEQICYLELITFARTRFYCGKIVPKSKKINIEISDKEEVKQIAGYLKNDIIVGLEFELI